jgi:hypothetical protein
MRKFSKKSSMCRRISQHYDASTDGTDSYQLLMQENGELKEALKR